MRIVPDVAQRGVELPSCAADVPAPEQRERENGRRQLGNPSSDFNGAVGTVIMATRR
jgi:hypothetical protein